VSGERADQYPSSHWPETRVLAGQSKSQSKGQFHRLSFKEIQLRSAVFSDFEVKFPHIFWAFLRKHRFNILGTDSLI
jgi:hypothetical protein